MIKIDLHTHSNASKDGGITTDQYKKILENETLDIIAVTDHDRIDRAFEIQKVLGKEKIIVGQEITTTEGDIIGLYLDKAIEPGLSVKDAATQIHKQGGLVCIPHPFEKVRKGLNIESLNSIINEVDCIEGHNGRALSQSKGHKAVAWGLDNKKVVIANSDAHGARGLGQTYTIIQSRPKDADELLKQLKTSKLVFSRPSIPSLFYPKINKLRNAFGRK